MLVANFGGEPLMPRNIRMMSLLVLPAALGLLIAPAAADELSPVGRWRTYDSETNELRSVVEITAVGDTLEAKVVKRFPPPGDPTHGICGACRGDHKGKPILGMTVMWGVKRDGDGWDGGTVLQPTTGKEYHVELHLKDGGQRLDVRGYIGSPLFGPTQTWIKDN
jgi:uncharacterized protein (DUF2147 family)